MIDASAVVRSHSFGGGPAGALGELADRLAHPVDLYDERYPVPFIPVVHSDASDNELSVVRHLSGELGLGASVRHKVASSQGRSIDQALELLRLDTTELDLIIDLGYVPELTNGLHEQISGAITTAAGHGSFRSMSLLSGSVPPKLERTSLWEQPRVEEHLWQTLAHERASGLRLGDYGVVHPNPGPSFTSKHVALKYTCPHHWLYSRERTPDPGDVLSAASTEGRRARTFRAVCRNLVESGDFAGPDFSWGDREILSSAEGGGRALGSTSRPVALATSHHLGHLASLDAT